MKQWLDYSHIIPFLGLIWTGEHAVGLGIRGNEKASISAGFWLSGGRTRNDHWLRASASILELAAVSRMNQQTARVQAITPVAYQ